MAFSGSRVETGRQNGSEARCGSVDNLATPILGITATPIGAAVAEGFAAVGVAVGGESW